MNIKEKKILIIGSTGMLGSAIKRKLKQSKYKNILSPKKNELNLFYKNRVYKYFKKNKPELVILCAAKVGGIKDNNENKLSYLEDNVLIQDNFFNAIKHFNIKKSIFVSSSCVYPKDSTRAIKEDFFMSGKLEETNEGFALAKIMGIKKAKFFFEKYKILVLCPIICNIYGTNDNYDPERSHVMSALIKKYVDAKKKNAKEVKLWGSGKPVREFMHVDDAALALIKLLEKHNSHEIINIGSSEIISIKNLSKKIMKIVGYKGKTIWDKKMKDGMFKKYLDITKFKKFKFKPKYNLDKGIKKTVLEYKNITQ